VPTISKTQIDLYRLYFLVKERGGLVEVGNHFTNVSMSAVHKPNFAL